MIFGQDSGFRRRIATAARDDGGFSIVEVLAASIIFLVLSVGVAQATVTSIRFAADQRNRITALSLAASEIDKVRGLADPFDIDPDVSTDIVIDGSTYTVTRLAEWVDSSGLDIPCGAGGTGNMQYMRVNVRVTWDTRMQVTDPVSSDTVMAPDGRINDPSRGTIMVSVTGAGGSKSAGVAVTITPTSGGAALDAQPDNTNSAGCTYALKVAPGTYSVALSRSGYISSEQATNPTQSVTVVAGGTVSASFAYDNASTLALVYGSGSGSNWYPTNYETTFVNTYGTYYVSGTSSSVKLYPHGGYTAIAGHYVAPDADGVGGCRAVDPAEWQPGTVGSVALGAGVASEPLAATAGGTASGTVRMGIVRVNNVPNNQYVTAVSQATPVAAGQPTCTVGMTYRFGRVSTGSGSGSRDLVLPFGTWKLYYSGTSGGTTTAITAPNIQPQTNFAPTGLVSAGTVTLDPRGAP